MRIKGLNLERFSQLSGVSERFLSAIIKGETKRLPAAPYIHGYVLKIAKVLNLEGEMLWQEYLKTNASLRRSGKNDLLPANRFVITPLNKKIIILVFIIAVVGGYGLFKLSPLFEKPELNLVNLESEVTYVQGPSFTISGKTLPSNRLTLNGEQIYPDKEGGFEKQIMLQPGFNTFTFKVKKFLGQERTITKQIFYQAPPVINFNPEPRTDFFQQ